MNKHRLLISSFMIVVSMILIVITTVTAWMAFVGKRPLATFQTATLQVTTKINKFEQTELITINNLTYVDFNNDIVLNKTNSLNKIATVITVQIINGENSLPIKNTIQILELNNKVGLFMMYIFEGKNVPENLIGSSYDYSSRIKSIIGSTIIPGLQRHLLSTHNSNVLNTINQTQLNPSEYLSFKIAIWGDYELVVNKTAYLSEIYNLQLKIITNQANQGG